jgi:hypothetical protein
MDDALQKSFSSDLKDKYPGGRWITITDEASPLHGRHLFIINHKDGSASVLVGGGSAMKHKTLTTKRKEPEEGKESDRPGAETATEASKQEAPPAKEEPKKPELSEEDRLVAETHIKDLTKQLKDKKSEMYGFIQSKLGVTRELTPEESKKIEKKIEHIADPVERSVAEHIEKKKILDEKDQAINTIVKQAKAAILEENPSAQGEAHSIAAAVKENAEELIQMHMAIRAIEKERHDIRKMVHIGKLHDRFKAGHDIAASFAPLSADEIKKVLSDEKALQAELDAHYKLMKISRGVVGDDASGGDTKMESNIHQGGFETITGFVGQETGRTIMTKKVYDALGSNNAAILSRYYLEQNGHDMKGIAGSLEKYLTAEGNPVAFKANDQGKYFMDLAARVKAFGQGSDNIMTINQATGTSLKYINKAYEAYGQAEGALNQGAELLYALKNRTKEAIEFTSTYTDSLDRKRVDLGLKAKDVSIKKNTDGTFTMRVPPKSFGKLIHEEQTEKHGEGLGLEYTAEEIKEGKANTDDFHPTGINQYEPPDKDGVRKKITIDPVKQAAARLIAAKKKVYLDFSAGTGKSLTYLLAKAHLDDLHGKPHKMIVSMPSKLLPNFRDEVRKFTNYNVVMINGQTPAARRKLYQSDPNTIVLVNKEKFNFDAAAIKDAKFDIVVPDEAHKITQREGRTASQMSQGLFDVGMDAPYYIPGSGTFAGSDVSELYAHMHVMNPKRFSSPKEFMHLFGSVHKGVGYKDQIKNFMLQHLGDHIISARKSDRKYEFRLHTHEVPLHPEQQKEYKTIADSFRNKEIHPFQRDQQFNSLLNSFDHEKNGKFAQAKQIIDHHLKTKAPDEKVIFYAKNWETVNEINKFISKHYPEFDHVEFTGTTKKRELDRLKQKFKHDPETKFSIHMNAGVEGLNLQYNGNGGGATTAIAIASGADSYAPLDQFFSRADRTGALKDIDAHLLLTDTPHDIGTQVRLQEKKAVGHLLDANVKKIAKALSWLFMFKKAA